MRRVRRNRGWTTIILLALPLAACGTTGTGDAIYAGSAAAAAVAGTADLGVSGTGTTDPGSRFVGSSQPIGGLTVETAPVDLADSSSWLPAPAPGPRPVRRATVPPRPPPPRILRAPFDPNRQDLPGQPVR